MNKFKTCFAKYLEKYPTLMVSVGYVLFAIVFTFPLVLHLSTQIPKGGGDVYQVISSIDNEVVQLKTLDFAHKFIFLAKKINVFMPYVIFNFIFNKFTAYNILFLLTYVLSGTGMFLLARWFTKNASASFLAGLIYAFSPFHYYQSTSVHLGTMQQQWLPFLILALFLFFEKFQFRHFVSVCFFAFMIAMAEHQMLAFTVLFVIMLAVYKIIIDRSILKNRKFWVYVVCSLGLLVMVAVFMFGDMLKVATSDNNFLDAGVNAANRYSILVLDPLAPPIFHSIWPGISEFVQNIILGGTNRGSYFVGFSVLGLLIYFARSIKKKRVEEISKREYRNDIIFWSASSLLFYVFSLGNSFSLGKVTIYLPYFLIYKFLPFYENIRTTGRMFVFVMLGISVLFAYAYAHLQKQYSQKTHLLLGIFSVIIMLEFWVAPIPLMVVSYSPFYDQIAIDSGQYKLLEIPGSTDYEFASYTMYTSSVHHKPSLNGMPLARKVPGEFDMQQNTPVIKQLLYTIAKGNDPDTKDNADILASFNYTESNNVLSYYGVRYITISKLYANKDVQNLAQKFIEAHIAYVSKYEDDFLIAYEVKQVEPSGIYVNLNDVENNQFSSDFLGGDKKKNREMGDGAGLKIQNMNSVAEKVKITLTATGPTGLKIKSPSDSQPNSFLVTGEVPKQYSFDTILAPGENIVTFSVKDANGQAVSISTSKKKHQAAIVSNISVESL